jgi:hypothetical protein
VTIAAVDLTRTALRWMPGTGDVAKAAPPVAKAGVVPEADRARVVAVFNGGWQPMHGRWGMRLSEHVILPARENGCTIGMRRDGTVALAPWPTIAPAEAELLAFRQTPPCMLHDGELHPELSKGNERPWGGNTANVVTRRRSASARTSESSFMPSASKRGRAC